MVCNRENLISKATGGHFSCSPELVEKLSSANSVDDFKAIVKEHGGLVIRYLDRVVVQDDSYEVIFNAGVTVEVEI